MIANRMVALEKMYFPTCVVLQDLDKKEKNEDDDKDYKHFVDVKEEDYQVIENDKNINSQSLESSDFGRLDDLMKDSAISDSEADDGENLVHAFTFEDSNCNENEDLLGNVMTSNQQAKHFESSKNRLEMKGSDRPSKRNIIGKLGYYNPGMRASLWQCKSSMLVGADSFDIICPCS
ncbi:hypothetical protein SUGI_0398110 [Cryptomeria japonica]|nr:hypothetical protein SUGI_0398110 [Cryptomeria japonica]